MTRKTDLFETPRLQARAPHGPKPRIGRHAVQPLPSAIAAVMTVILALCIMLPAYTGSALGTGADGSAGAPASDEIDIEASAAPAGEQATANAADATTAPRSLQASALDPHAADDGDGAGGTGSEGDGEEEHTETYTVTWKNHNGTVLETDTDVAWGTMPAYNGATPTRTSSSEGQYQFSHWDPALAPVTADVKYTAQFTTAPIVLCIQDMVSGLAIADASFTLENSAGTVVWSATTDASGVLPISRVAEEKENGKGALFAPGSTYTLRQTATNSTHFVAQGSWTVSVSAEGTFTMKRNYQAGDLSTREPDGPYGVRFYLYNLSSSRITYDYNYPKGVSGQPEDRTASLGFLSYDGSYTVDVDDPALEGYEFAGWSIDKMSRTVKKGDVIKLDTVNVAEHTMTACWRNPLNVQALVYSGTSSSKADPVDASKGTFALTAERTLTFSSLAGACEAYGQQNGAVKELNESAKYSFVFAEAKTASGESARITSLRYDATAHAWQYAASAGWTDIAQGDELLLYYISNVAKVRWVVEDADGALSALDESAYPQHDIALASSWTSTDDLLTADQRPVVHGLHYYRSLGFGAADAASTADLELSGLASFSLKNGESGLRFRTGGSGDGDTVKGDTVYVVYSATPPENTVYLGIDNLSNYPYALESLNVGTANLLARDRVVLVGDESLRLLDDTSSIAAGSVAKLALLGAGAGSFVLDGGFAGDIAAGTAVSVAVTGSGKVVRRALVKTEDGSELASTASVTTGALEADPAQVTVSFDSDLFDLTLQKTWSDDSYPSGYSVDLALYEDGKLCAADGSNSAGHYTVTEKDGWQTTVRYLPRRLSEQYAAAEQAVRITRTNADVTGSFQAVSSREGDAITIANTRANPVCRVGSTEFTTVKAAVDFIVSQGTKSGAVIEMIADYIMAQSGSVTIPAGYDIALTTAEGESAKTITRGFAGEADLFKVEGSLTLTNVTLTGKLGESTLAKTGNGGLVRVVGSNASLTAGGGAVLSDARADNGAAIYAQNGATVKLDGAHITGNHAVTGGAVGVSDASCRVLLTGDTYVYGNQRDNANGQFNIFLDQDSNEVLRVIGAGLGDAAQVGIRVADGESQSIYDAHGKPAKPFATYEDSAAGTLGKLSNDRLGSGPSKFGAASTILEHTAVWGETFSFTVDVQWLDDRFNVAGAPDGAEVTLKLNGSSTTPAESVKTSFDLDANTGWTCTFTGLARYDGNGKPYEYTVTETRKPDDYKQVVFTGDKAVKDNPVTYSAATGDGQTAIVSNYYRYTELTVNKDVDPNTQGLKSSFAVYRVPKSGANLTRDGGAIRYGGVGSASDLPLALRGGVASADGVPTGGLFYTDGGNVWRANVDGSTVTFHRFYDVAFGEFACDASGAIGTLDSGESWQAGDVVRYDDAGNCKVYGADNVWHAIAPKAAVGYLQFDRQDGYTGAESVGGESANAGCTIEGSGSYTFEAEDKKLSSDYYYYVVETSVQETNGKGRTISTSHKIVATYDPSYSYDQLRQIVNVKNTRRDFLSVDKMWPADATTMGTCTFDVYRVKAGGTVSTLKSASEFKAIVTGDASGWEKVGEAQLPEPNGSWVHVLEDISQDDLEAYVYFVRERSAGGVAILNPDVTESSTKVDATYEYDDKVNQITVHNLSDILCKIVDRDGEHPFRSLNDALAYGRTRDNGESNTEFTIQMLRDYSIPAGDIMQLKETEQITLTTASATSGEYKYHNDDASKTKATIVRKGGNTWPFIIVAGGVGTADTTSITLENIEFDGAGTQVNTTNNTVFRGNGGLVYASYATVVLRKGGDTAAGAEMRNGKAYNGGGIYAANSTVTVRDAVFEGCASTDTNGTAGVAGGGAIWTNGTGTTTVAGSTFTACTAKYSGGAIASMYQSAAAADGEQTLVTGCTFDRCVSEVNGGAVYSRNALLTVGVFTVDGKAEGATCTFKECTGYYRGGGVYHDNMQKGSATNVGGCTFDACKTTSGDTGQNSRHGGAGLNSCAGALTLHDCTFTECVSQLRGGGVLHFNLAASTSKLSDCTFKDCTAARTGGAGGGGVGLTGIEQHLERCTFDNCNAVSGAGGGLDVACFNVDKDALIEDCTFTGCTAGNANGGGICFGGGTLEAKRTTFTGCTATANNTNGGGIAVSAGGTMAKLGLEECTFTSCTAPQGSGGGAFTNSTALEASETEFVSCSVRSTGGAVYQSPSNNTGLSTATMTHCTFTGCSSETGSGGGMYTSVKTVAVTGTEGKATFKDCTSVNQGGGLRHERGSMKSELTLSTCTFDNCRSTNSDGGGAWTYATVATLTSCDFSTCTSRSSGGGFCQIIPNNDYIDDSSTTLTGSSFAGCKSEASWGGSLYTSAKALSITGEAGVTTFQNSSAASGGGSVYHNRGARTASVTLKQCSFDTSTASGERGGALCTWAPVLDMQGCSFDTCTSWASGGAVCQGIDGNYLTDSGTTVSDSTFDTCTSLNGWGGALYANAKTLTLTGVKSAMSFEGCSSRYAGGSVYHDRSGKDTSTTLKQCSFNTSTVSNERGGALCTWATVLSMEDSSFKNCSSSSNGGSVCHGPSGNYPGDSAMSAKRCSFTDSTSTSNDGGGLYTTATTVTLDQTPFANCKARQTGGGLCHGLSNNDQIALSNITMTRCTFKDCKSELSSAGGAYSSAQKLSATGEQNVTTFANCTAYKEGGGLVHNRSTVASQATLDTCSFEDCTSTASDGGGLWTRATTASVKAGSFKDCTARNYAGGLHHWLGSNDQVATSSLRIEKSSFKNCTAHYQHGGAVICNAMSFTADGGTGTTSFTNCSAAYDGGAVYHTRNNAGSTMTLSACSFKKCTSTYTSGNSSRGGAVYVTARSVTVSGSQFAECTAKNSGGCIFHEPGTDTGSTTTLTVTDSTFSNSTSTTGYGGGIYSQRSAVTLTKTALENCSATHGGGLFQASSETRPVVLDACTVTGNSATTRGGGVYFDSNNSITLRNGTRVTGNTLGNAAVDNGAGVYLLQDRNQATLVLGREGASEDTITVYDNKTSEGEQSNVRLIRSGTWDNKTQRWYDRNTSVSLLSNLVKESAGATGSIGVCNPGPANTQFGLEDAPGRTGMEYIVSDIDTLRGKLDPTDHEELKVIWYAPPVCKITDKTGYPLQYGDGKVAAFATLKDAFEVLNTLTKGYLKDSNGVAFDPGDESREIHIEMLVSDYKLEANMPELRRDVTITTASLGKTEYDYPLSATSETCTITRGANATGSMFTVGTGAELTVRDIVLDGGSKGEKPQTPQVNGGIIYGKTDAHIVLGKGCVLQNSAVGDGCNGGAVYVTGTSDSNKPSLVMERDATITGCSAANGGGVYLTAGAVFVMNNAPHIEDCTATTAGGAVYVSPNATTAFRENPVAVIRGNAVTSTSGAGAGIYLAAPSSKLELALEYGGAISGNVVLDSAQQGRTNGGDDYQELHQDIYIAGTGDPIGSLVLAGDLAVAEGSIWVWAESANHYKTDTQFAVVKTNASGELAFSPSTESLAAFRNARDDVETENGTDTYLYGEQGEGNQIVWSFMPDAHKVVLRKVAQGADGGDYRMLEGAKFTVYRGKSSKPFSAKNADGTKQELKELESDESGIFWVGDLPYGIYYLHETTMPAGSDPAEEWFKLTLSEEDGMSMSKGYPTRQDAANGE